MSGRANDHEAEVDEPGTNRPFQYTLRHLWGAMFVVAVSFGTARALGNSIPVFLGLNALLLMAFVLILQFLDRRNRWVVLIGFLAACAFVVISETLILLALGPFV
jgi:hypothetical protein